VVEVRAVAEMCSAGARAVSEGLVPADLYQETVAAK
jgi:hypothetical protein